MKVDFTDLGIGAIKVAPPAVGAVTMSPGLPQQLLTAGCLLYTALLIIKFGIDNFPAWGRRLYVAYQWALMRLAKHANKYGRRSGDGSQD